MVTDAESKRKAREVLAKAGVSMGMDIDGHAAGNTHAHTHTHTTSTNALACSQHTCNATGIIGACKESVYTLAVCILRWVCMSVCVCVCVCVSLSCRS